MKGSLTHKIALGFGIALVLLLAMDGLSYLSVSSLLRTNQAVMQGHTTLDALGQLQQQMQDAETGQRGFLLTGDARYLEPYHAATLLVDDELNHLKVLLDSSAETRQRLEQLARLTRDKFEELRQTIELRTSGATEDAVFVVQSGRGKATMDEIRRLIRLLKGDIEARLTLQQAQAAAGAHRSLGAYVAGSLAGFVMLAFAFAVISRDVSARQRAEESLQAAHAALEQRVDERTEELARVNEGLRSEVSERRTVESRLADLLQQVERSRDDLLLVFDRLRAGTALTDRNGRLAFVNQAAERLLGRSRTTIEGKLWTEALPFDAKDIAQLSAMTACPPAQRTKVPVSVEVEGGARYWMDIEIQDDPRDQARKIFFLYDTSDVYNLRRMLDERAQFHALVGKSRTMQAVYQQIRDVSHTDSTVLIEGETGTGKELVARAIHATSHRQDEPFVAVNSGGLTESLVGSQLFGHRRGAFTGAVEDHKGLFESANGGTLFLDEIGDVPLSMQASLLRVLQEREVVRLGDSKPRKIDVRILAATNRDLAADVESGRFRADLLYRIRVARIRLPALRERRDDLPLLVVSFVAEQRAATGNAVEDISAEALRVLAEYDWPGNVRELRSAVEYAFIRCQGNSIQVDDLPPEIVHQAYTPRAYAGPANRPLTGPEAGIALRDALTRSRGNRTMTARMLGISRATLYRRLADLEVESK